MINLSISGGPRYHLQMGRYIEKFIHRFDIKISCRRPRRR